MTLGYSESFNEEVIKKNSEIDQQDNEIIQMLDQKNEELMKKIQQEKDKQEKVKELEIQGFQQRVGIYYFILFYWIISF